MTAPSTDYEMPASLNPKRQSDRRLSQSLRRATWPDQWGRRWLGQAHRDHGHPVGQITLHPRYRVPHRYLVPPPQFMDFQLEGEDNRVTIKLGEWQEVTASAWKRYKGRLWKAARKLYKEKAEGEVAAMNPDLIEIVGPPPMHEKFLAAMAVGNRWVLGIPNPKTGEMDPTPAWATADLLETLKIHETFDGGGTPAQFTADELAEFANPDDDGAYTADTADIVARLDGAARFETLDDETDPPTPPRGNRGQFTKKNP